MTTGDAFHEGAAPTPWPFPMTWRSNRPFGFPRSVRLAWGRELPRVSLAVLKSGQPHTKTVPPYTPQPASSWSHGTSSTSVLTANTSTVVTNSRRNPLLVEAQGPPGPQRGLHVHHPTEHDAQGPVHRTRGVKMTAATSEDATLMTLVVATAFRKGRRNAPRNAAVSRVTWPPLKKPPYIAGSRVKPYPRARRR